MTTILITALFGAVGVLARYAVDRAVDLAWAPAFPLATLAINIVGSFALGLVFTLGHERNFISPEMTLALTVGLLGGFTTFSTFSLQVVQMFEQKQNAIALVYAAGSPALGVIAAFAGAYVARFLNR